jgi:hypothetical protein
MELHVEKVDRIFQTQSIYKSVLVCERNRIRSLHTALRERDFPVSTIDQLAKFVTSNDRILLLCPSDANNLNLILGNALHVRGEVSALICVKGTKFVPTKSYWEGVPIFFV